LRCCQKDAFLSVSSLFLLGPAPSFPPRTSYRLNPSPPLSLDRNASLFLFLRPQPSFVFCGNFLFVSSPPPHLRVERLPSDVKLITPPPPSRSPCPRRPNRGSLHLFCFCILPFSTFLPLPVFSRFQFAVLDLRGFMPTGMVCRSVFFSVGLRHPSPALKLRVRSFSYHFVRCFSCRISVLRQCEQERLFNSLHPHGLFVGRRFV